MAIKLVVKEKAVTFWRRFRAWIVGVPLLLIEEATLGLIKSFFKWLWTLRDMPLREGGVFVLFVFAVAFAWVVIDPSTLIRAFRKGESVADIEKRIRKEVSEEMEVERARELLQGHALRSGHDAEQLLRAIHHHLELEFHYGNEGLAEKAERLAQSLNRLRSALTGNSHTKLRPMLREFIDDYGLVVVAINQFRQRYPAVAQQQLATGIERLKESHAILAANTALLAQRTWYQGMEVAVRPDFDKIGPRI